MKLFIDSADIEEIQKVLDKGILEGVTTNPSLIKKAFEKYTKKDKKLDLETYIKKMLKVCRGKPVSLEVVGDTFEEMVSEGKTIYKKFNPVAKNVYVKIPVNPCMEKFCSHDADGIKAIKKLSQKKIPVNCTLIFTPEQALLAAQAGAKIVSPFVGREDDYIREINHLHFSKEDYFPASGFRKGKKILNDEGIVSGIKLVEEISAIFKKNKIKTEILAASIRNRRQFRDAALAGADIVTVPYSVIIELLKHPKTMEGMSQFTKDSVNEYKKIVRK
ncbi:MAG: transaldolase [archaeon]|jgi:transaldolase